MARKEEEKRREMNKVAILKVRVYFPEEERRLALVMARKEEEKRREMNKVAILKVRVYFPSISPPPPPFLSPVWFFSLNKPYC